MAMAAAFTTPMTDKFNFAVRYRTGEIDGGVPWLDYSLHPASKLGLHNALLAQHDRIEILEARGGVFECAVFIVRQGQLERLSQEGAERLFATLPHGEVKWIDLCRCLLPPVQVSESPNQKTAAVAPAPAESPQIQLFPHTHTLYDDVEEHVVHHLLDVDA